MSSSPTARGPVAGIHACAPWTRSQAVDPVGTAGTYDNVLLVEVPRPWPNDIGHIPALTEATNRDPRSRVLAVVPRSETKPGLVRVVHWKREPGTTRYSGVDHLTVPQSVTSLLISLIDHSDDDHPAAVAIAPPEVLLCGHGSRDRCCGKSGTRLHAEVRDRWEHVRTWQCSHTGGHRFAPTGLTFPDGRAWAFLDASILDGVISRSAEPDRLRGHYRGSLALTSWTQAVEREAFCRLGWSWLDCEFVESFVFPSPDGVKCDVELTWAGPAGQGRLLARVEIGRHIPIFPCGTAPTEAIKAAPELVITSLDWTGSAPQHPDSVSPAGPYEAPTGPDSRPPA